MAKQIRVLGIDLSLNHSGFVLVDAITLRPVRSLYVTTKAASIKEAQPARGVEGLRIPNKFEHTDANGRNYKRLLWWLYFFDQLRQNPDFACRYVGIEDYALHSRSGSTHQIAELGAIARLAFRHCRLRYHEPMTVKIYVTGVGNAEPSETELNVRKRWGVDFRRYNGSRSGHRPSEDLATAYALARMVAVEWQMRKGKMTMQDLEECEIRVFNRGTKSNPTNLLARDWIVDPFCNHKTGKVRWPRGGA